MSAPDPSAGPGYWQNETTGVVRRAITAYLAGGVLTGEHIAAIRAYLRQWVGAPIWDQNPHATNADIAKLTALRDGVDRLTSREAIDEWLDDAEAFGIDPL